MIVQDGCYVRWLTCVGVGPRSWDGLILDVFLMGARIVFGISIFSKHRSQSKEIGPSKPTTTRRRANENTPAMIPRKSTRAKAAGTSGTLRDSGRVSAKTSTPEDVCLALMPTEILMEIVKLVAGEEPVNPDFPEPSPDLVKFSRTCKAAYLCSLALLFQDVSPV